MDYKDFMPKHQGVLVGTTELRVTEYTIAKRDAVLRILLSGLDIVTLVKPFWDAISTARDTKKSATVNLVELAAQLKDTVLKLVGNDLTTIACLTLDTKKNRSDANIAEDELQVNSEHGFEFSPTMFRFVKENLTQRQEQEVLAGILKVNDFVGLVKNYKTLVVSTMNAARDN